MRTRGEPQQSRSTVSNPPLWLALLIVVCSVTAASAVHAGVLVSADGTAPVIVTLMTHTDGTYATDAAFNTDVRRIRHGSSLYVPRGVKMNLEASKEFAAREAALRTGVLSDLLALGHGVGTHCNDVVATRIEPVAALAARMAANKAAVDALVGSANNVSVSGICSRVDWVLAASAAGFTITDAAVGLCYLSMPLPIRPPGWTDALIVSTYFHDPVPVDPADRIAPMRLMNARDFVSDAAGVLTLSNGELGELPSLAEGRRGCGATCPLETADLDVAYAAIEWVAAHKSATQVGRINIHVPATLFVTAHDALLGEFLDRLKTYADAHVIVFGTQKDVSDTYDVWR
jgi:hypothetical protein